MSEKWGKKFWVDLSERVVATFVGALLSAITLTGTTPIDWSDEKVIWIILGMPTLVALLKGLLRNLASSDAEPSASLVGVTSNTY